MFSNPFGGTLLPSGAGSAFFIQRGTCMCKLDEVKRHTDDVKRLVRGRWDEVFMRLVPQIAPALERPGRRVDCPFHGGKGDFRVAHDYLDNGKCFCTCGTWDGFGMVMHVRREVA